MTNTMYEGNHLTSVFSVKKTFYGIKKKDHYNMTQGLFRKDSLLSLDFDTVYQVVRIEMFVYYAT